VLVGLSPGGGGGGGGGGASTAHEQGGADAAAPKAFNSATAATTTAGEWGGRGWGSVGGVLRRRWCSVPRPTSVDKPAASVLAAVWTASCLCNVCSRPEVLIPPRCMPLGGPAGSQQQQPGGSEGRTRRRSLTEVAVRTVQGLGPAAPLDNGALHRHAPPLNSIPAPSHHCDCAVCLLVVAAAAVWLLIGPHHGVSQAISPPDPWTNAVRRVPLLLRAPKPACLRTQHACCHVCAPRDGMPWIAEPPRCVTPAYLSSP
jgi:hypothetical protein